MADPTRYTPGFNYSGWEADHPTEPKPGAELDNDFAHIRHSIDETIRALHDVRRSDGHLSNAIVDFDALNPAVKAAIAGSEFDYEVIEDLLVKDANLQDLPDKEEARENLEVLGRGKNLADLDDPVSAGANLGVLAFARQAEDVHIPQALKALRALGRSAPGDGDVPVLVEGEQKDGAVQDADGRWFEDVGYNTITVRIPSRFPTLQAAVDHYSRLPLRQGAKVVLLIENGHRPASGISVEDGDFSHFWVEAEGSEVSLDPDFGRSGTAFIRADNACAPTLNCLIDANEQLGNGYIVTNASRGRVMPGSGIKRVWGTGLNIMYGSTVSARNTIWTDCAVNGNTGSGIVANSGYGDVEGADASRSGYYGIQAAYGAVLNARYTKANDCLRYAYRSRNAAFLHCESGEGDNAGVNAIRVFNGGFCSARYFVGRNAGDDGAYAAGASILHARDSDFSGAARFGVGAHTASIVDAADTNAQKGASPSSDDFVVTAGSTIYRGSGSIGGNSQTPNLATGSGMIYDASARNFPGITGWTPELTCSNPGNLNVTHSTAVGRCIEMGNVVTVTFTILADVTHSTASGAVRIAGLPFPGVDLFETTWHGAAVHSGINKSGFTDFALELGPGGDAINIRASRQGGNRAFVNIDDLPSGSSIRLEGTLTYWRG